MTRELIHRGPDGEGFYLDDHIALGHRRLAIVDREGGAQPMAGASGAAQIVFNGEIYNDLSLRAQLTARGHGFRTASDTESILCAYDEWGVDCVDRLEGMFAFALWDGSRRRLLLARDRFGKKPLHYAWGAGGALAFASELKGLSPFPGLDRSIDTQALSDYLSLSYVPREKTIWRGVRKLLPGHILVIDGDRSLLRRYWDLSFAGSGETADDARRVRAALGDAVRARLRSDVPLGAFLSGGLDSSSVVGLMTEAGAGPVMTTAMGFAEASWDERPYAQAAARAFGTDHRDAVMDASPLDLLETMRRLFDEPFADASALPTYFLSQLARQRVTVALSGDGGDEVFGGYRRYVFDVRENRIRSYLPAPWGPRIFALAGALYPERESMARFLRGKALLGNLGRTPWGAYFHSVSAMGTHEKNSLLQPDLLADLGGYASEGVFEELYRRADGPDSLSKVQYIDFNTYLPDDILTKVDRASMAHSLEVRCPFLDRRLVELVASLPSSRKVHGGRTKILLREAVADLVPAPILGRAKMGFAVPLDAVLRSVPSDQVEDRLLRSVSLAPLVVPAQVRRLWDEHRSGRHDRSRVLWCLLVLAKWLAANESPRIAA